MPDPMPPTLNPISWTDLPTWAERLADQEDRVFRDLQLFQLFTGVDAAEVCAVPTAGVNFDATFFCRRAPADSGLDNFPHPLPISLTLMTIHRRFGNEAAHGADNTWLFPASGGGEVEAHFPVPATPDVTLDATGESWPGPTRLRDTFLQAAVDSEADPLDVHTLLSPFDPTLPASARARTAKRQRELADCIEQVAGHLEQRMGPAVQHLLGVHFC